MSIDPSTDRREHASTSSLHAFHAPSQEVNHRMQNSDSLAAMVSVFQFKVYHADAAYQVMKRQVAKLCGLDS